jgi:hypothetical protein
MSHYVCYDVRVEQNHWPKSKGAGIGFLADSARSTPRIGANRAQIESAKLALVQTTSFNASRKIASASSSIEWPFGG